MLEGAALGFTPYERFIDFNAGVRATERGIITRRPCHGLPNAVAHEPSSFVADPEHALDPLGTHGLPGRTQRVIAKLPFAECHFGTLKNGANGDGECATRSPRGSATAGPVKRKLTNLD